MKLKYWIVFSLLFLLLIGTVGIFVWKPNSASKKTIPLTQKLEVNEVAANEQLGLYKFQDTKETYELMQSFILERIYNQDIFLEFDIVKQNRKSTVEELHSNHFNVLYSAIKEQDLDLFVSLFSGDAIQEVWNGEIDFEKRLANLTKALNKLSRDNRFEALYYQLEIHEENEKGNSGILSISYSDKKGIIIPFTLEPIGEDDDVYYQFTNSILDMVNQIPS